MANDIRTFGTGEGVGFYWVRGTSGVEGHYSSSLTLLAIDELGNVTDTRTRATDDPAALDRAGAVMEHLSGAISEADAHLEKRRAMLKENPPPEPPPIIDPATHNFLYGGD